MSYKKKRHQPINGLELLVNKLKKNRIEYNTFLEHLSGVETKFFENPELEFELLISNGLPLSVNESNEVFLKTAQTTLKEQTFCVVDIETNGSNIHKGQIIELGAVKFKNGKIIETYDSLVYAKEIPAMCKKSLKFDLKCYNLLQDYLSCLKSLNSF
jgi:DNA polymerase-3 subunit epsilon